MHAFDSSLKDSCSLALKLYFCDDISHVRFFVCKQIRENYVHLSAWQDFLAALYFKLTFVGKQSAAFHTMQFNKMKTLPMRLMPRFKPVPAESDCQAVTLATKYYEGYTVLKLKHFESELGCLCAATNTKPCSRLISKEKNNVCCKNARNCITLVDVPP